MQAPKPSPERLAEGVCGGFVDCDDCCGGYGGFDYEFVGGQR